MAKGHESLIRNLVTAFAAVAGVLFLFTEFQLEFDELVLLVWCILWPITALIGLVAPLFQQSAELRLYLVVLVIAPALLLYFFGDLFSFDEVVLLSICAAPVVSFLRLLRESMRRQFPSWNRDFWRERLPELFLLITVGVLPIAATTEFGLMELDDSVLLFFCVFAPVAFAIHDSPALRVAREALAESPSLFKRVSIVLALVDALMMFGIAVILPIVGYYGELHLDVDEAVMLFPCGLLPAYCITKVSLSRLFSCMWSDVVVGIGDRLSSYGSMKSLIAPAKNGGDAPPWAGYKKEGRDKRWFDRLWVDIDHGDLSAAEDAIRQERRSQHGAAANSPSAPTTPRDLARQHHWHHRHRHFGGENAPDKIHLPRHIRDPLQPHHMSREREDDGKSSDGKRFKHRSNSLAASGAGAIELPTYSAADPNLQTPPGSGRRWHQQHGMDGTRKAEGHTTAGSFRRKEQRAKTAPRRARAASGNPSSINQGGKGDGGKGRRESGGGGGGLFSFMRGGSKPTPEPAACNRVSEGQESRASWGADSEASSPGKRERARSNSFSLTLNRRSRAEKADKARGGAVNGGRAAGGGVRTTPLDAPEAAGNAAEVRQLMERGPLGGKNRGANADDMYSA